MKEYIGVKLIKAEEALGCVGKLYTSASPAGVKTEDGYKVVYEGGYESWSPQDTFEKAYKQLKLKVPKVPQELPEWKLRVINEANELSNKVTKLSSFVNNSDITLDDDDVNTLMEQQLLAMQYYLTVLIERIEKF